MQLFSNFRAEQMPFRLWNMLIGWGSVGLVYSLTSSKDPSTAHLLVPGAIDRWFDFDPGAIWLYMSFFLLVPLGFLAAPLNRVRWLARSFVLAALIAGIVFLLFPTTMTFPEVTQQGLSSDALRLLIAYDSMHNCLPSLHVTLTVLSVMVLWQRDYLWSSLIITFWGLAITISILQLYRHQFVDLAAGLAVALVAALVATWLARMRRPLMEPAE